VTVCALGADTQRAADLFSLQAPRQQGHDLGLALGQRCRPYRTAFFTGDVDARGERHGRLVEYDMTTKIFTSPADSRTEDYITARSGAVAGVHRALQASAWSG
jgi:hypothetical protein